MTSCLRVLTSASLDSSPCLLLVSPDGSKVLIDCGEGSQRAFIEYGQKVATVQAVCLTTLSHESVGGLPGFLLTSADIHALNNNTKNPSAGASAVTTTNTTGMEDNEIVVDPSDELNGAINTTTSPSRGGFHSRHAQKKDLHKRNPPWPFCPLQGNDRAHLHMFGPVGTRAYLEALRHFCRRSKFKTRVFEGEGATTSASVPVVPMAQSKSPQKKKNQPEPVRFSVSCLAFEQEEQIVVDDKHKNHRNNDTVEATQHAGVKRLRDDGGQKRQRRQTLSYLFTTPCIVGKFLPDKAMELGVPKGPMFAQLKAGHAVTFGRSNADGTTENVTVESHQVVTPSSPGIGVLVLRYPTLPECLEAFFQSLRLTERLDKAGAELDLVVHVAFPKVFTHPTAVQWRETCHGDHLWMNLADEAGTPHCSAATTAKVRAQLCPSVFRPLWCPVAVAATLDETTDSSNVIVGKPGVEYNLLPRAKKGFTETTTVDTDDAEATRMEQMEESGARQLAETIIENDKSQRSTRDGQESSKATLLFTGTASALPCKYRNVTGMLLSNTDGRSMLLDVGEGTVGQLLRMQTSKPDESRLLASITVAWISHPHADHHLGLLRLLEKRRATEPLLLIAPPPIFRFLQEYAREIDGRISKAYRGVDCRDFQKPNPDAIAELKNAIGFTNCQSIQVEHCPYAYAVIIDGTPFGRVVYSGDCRPCSKLAAAAKPVDVLIHESTFEDSMKTEAFLKKHCTIGEALGISKAMDAKCTILTHFSQRYPRIPPPTQVVDTSDMCIIFAFDFQCLTTDNLQLASRLTPALRLLYPEEDNAVDRQAEEDSVERQAQKVLATPGLFAKSELI